MDSLKKTGRLGGNIENGFATSIRGLTIFFQHHDPVNTYETLRICQEQKLWLPVFPSGTQLAQRLLEDSTVGRLWSAYCKLKF